MGLLFKKLLIWVKSYLVARLHFKSANVIGDFNLKNTKVVISIDDFNMKKSPIAFRAYYARLNLYPYNYLKNGTKLII